MDDEWESDEAQAAIDATLDDLCAVLSDGDPDRYLRLREEHGLA